MQELAKKLVGLCNARQISLVFAESCTGGALASAITNVPQASNCFIGSLVTYQDIAKHEILDVPLSVLSSEGAVSSAVAEKMLAGVLAKLPAKLGVAVTGFAGPEGGTPEEHIGTVYVAIGGQNIAKRVIRFQLEGVRHEIIQQTVTIVLLQLIQVMQDHPVL